MHVSVNTNLTFRFGGVCARKTNFSRKILEKEEEGEEREEEEGRWEERRKKKKRMTNP